MPRGRSRTLLSVHSGVPADYSPNLLKAPPPLSPHEPPSPHQQRSAFPPRSPYHQQSSHLGTSPHHPLTQSGRLHDAPPWARGGLSRATNSTPGAHYSDSLLEGRETAHSHSRLLWSPAPAAVSPALRRAVSATPHSDRYTPYTDTDPGTPKDPPETSPVPDEGGSPVPAVSPSLDISGVGTPLRATPGADGKRSLSPIRDESPLDEVSEYALCRADGGHGPVVHIFAERQGPFFMALVRRRQADHWRCFSPDGGWRALFIHPNKAPDVMPAFKCVTFVSVG